MSNFTHVFEVIHELELKEMNFIFVDFINV